MEATTKDDLNARLMLAVLARPGIGGCLDREGEFIRSLRETPSLNPKSVAKMRGVRIQDAEDACQDQVVTMLERLHDGRMYEVSRSYVDRGVWNHLTTRRRPHDLERTNIPFDEQLQQLSQVTAPALVEMMEGADCTPDERQVIEILGAGYSQAEIAGKLGVSQATVHRLKKSAFGKLRRDLDGDEPN